MLIGAFISAFAPAQVSSPAILVRMVSRLVMLTRVSRNFRFPNRFVPGVFRPARNCD
jgi:hypothetical protein